MRDLAAKTGPFCVKFRRAHFWNFPENTKCPVSKFGENIQFQNFREESQKKIKFHFFPKIWKFGHFWIFWKITKMRAPKFHAEWSGFHAEISHMRPIQGQKLKLEIDHFPDPLKN